MNFSDNEYPALNMRKCKKCGKEKMILFAFNRKLNTCKDCEREKRQAQRKATGSDPKMKWRSYGRRPQ